ncbi:MAG: fibronectin type III domain-containing protein, partial [Ruminococcus sp.]|nr:fibronectin type III domain-containing protein [Ruminococcus sp.]
IISAAAESDSTDVTSESTEPAEQVTAVATEPTTEETSTSTESGSESTSTAVTEDITKITTEPTSEPEEKIGDGIFSKLEIELCNQLEIEKEIECTVNIFRFKSDEEIIPVLTENITLGKEWNSVEKLSTDYIENGEYIVEIHAPGFEKFRETVSNFENMVCTLTVTLGFHKGYTYADTYQKNADGSFCVVGGDLVLKKSMDKEHPGVMRYGDVNNDGEISVTDEIILLNAVDSASRNADGNVNEEFAQDKNGNKYCLDLNNDGAVDIMDMALFTETYIDASNWNLSFSVDKKTSEKYDAFIFSESVKPLEDTESVGASIEELLAFTSSDNKENTDGEEDEKEPPKPMQLKPKTKIVTTEVPVLDDDGKAVLDENGNPVTKTEEKEEEVAISSEDPVGVNLPVPKAGTAGYSFGSNAEAGWIEYVDENGVTGFANFGDISALPAYLLDAETGADHVHNGQSSVNASVDKDGNITVNFGNQTAIKKISLKISAVSKSTNLAEIATVKVLNGMESKTPPPQIDYPTNLKIEQLKAEDKDAGIKFKWAKPLNGSGKYEFEVSTSPVTKSDGSFASVISGVTNNETEALEYVLQSEHGNFKLIKINTTYYVHVRCIGEDNYKSAWSDMVSVTTVSNNRPDKPDYVSATGGYKSMKVSWSSDNTNSTTGYRIYYRNITAEEEEYKPIEVGLVTSYQFTSLEDKAEYEFYVVGYNSKGDSPESVHAMGKTTSMDPIEMHKYNVINCDESGAVGKAHLISVTRNGGDSVGNDIDTENAASNK